MLLCLQLYFADHFHHSYIKVYLSAVHSLHTDYGYPDSLSNCLQLQQLLRGIKQHQGSNLPQAKCVPADLMAVLNQSLDLSNPDNVMLWAACCLGFFGFLWVGEFTTNSSFYPCVDLMPADLQVDSSSNLQSFRVFIKCAKTDPFWQGCFFFLGCDSALFRSWQATLIFVDQVLGLCLFSSMAIPFQRPFYVCFCNPPNMQLVFLWSSHVTALELALQLRPPREAFLTTSLRLWVTGQLKLIFCVHIRGHHPFGSW